MTQDQIQKLEADHAKLQADCDALKETIKRMKEEKESGTWSPKMNDRYWCVGSDASIISLKWDNANTDRKLLERGNVFRTEEEAEKADRKRVLETKLSSFTKGFVPDWSANCDQIKWFLTLDVGENEFLVCTSYRFNCCDRVYFATEADARNAIKEMGDELYELFGVAK